jgi:hypothetical protein
MTILADAGVPMIFLEYPAMLCGLLPVILAEFLVARRMLQLSRREALKGVAAANLLSTIVGFPLLWVLLVVMELCVGGGGAHGLSTIWSRIYAVTVQAPWLIPYESDLKWMIPLAALYLLVPAFFASVYLERWICFRFWRGQDRNGIRRFSWVAHYVSYSVLIVVASIYYGIILRRG